MYEQVTQRTCWIIHLIQMNERTAIRTLNITAQIRSTED